MNQLDLFANHNLSDVERTTFEACLQLAFEAGKWAGQVELEEHIDREQYASIAIEAVYSRNNAMPMRDSSIGKEVTITLRSQEWRDGVNRSANEYLRTAVKIFCDFIEKNNKTYKV